MPKKLTISISVVTYHTAEAMLEKLWQTMMQASRVLDTAGYPHELRPIIVDNSEPPDAIIDAFVKRRAHSATLHAAHGNVGYGAAHNLALEDLASDLHIFTNADVEVAPDALLHAVRFMEAHGDCGLLAPAVSEANGARQFLCKRYPAVLDLFLRGFAPRWLARCFRRRLEGYEMRDIISEDVLWNPPIVSGCFMVFRTSVLKQLGGFDPRFFLYFEDYDLALRAACVARTAYVPQVRIVHHGGNAARKGMKHVLLFIASAIKFYQKNGWKWV